MLLGYRVAPGSALGSDVTLFTYFGHRHFLYQLAKNTRLGDATVCCLHSAMPPKRLSNRLPLCLTLLLSARPFRLLWGSWLGSWANGATRGGFGCWPSGGLGWALVLLASVSRNVGATWNDKPSRKTRVSLERQWPCYQRDLVFLTVSPQQLEKFKKLTARHA